MLIDQLSNKTMDKLMPAIRRWNKQYKEAIPELNKMLIITHRDMHSLNILWDHEQKPYIIDWESAGLMNPLLEVIGYAREWGGVILGAHDFNKTVVVLASYKKAINKQFTQEEIEIGKNIILNKMIPCIEYLQVNETILLKKIFDQVRKIT